MKKVVRYQCGYCQKLAVRQETIEKHEAVCIKNPVGKNCYMCEIAYLDDYEIYNEYNGTYSTVKEQCMCAYQDDVISSVIGGGEGNLAPRCDHFKRADDGYWYRNRDQAEKNYEKLWGEKDG
jgi:hypothetical protein